MRHTFIFLFFLLAGFSLNAQALKGSAWSITSIDNLETGKSQVIDSKVKLSLKFDSDSAYSGVGCNPYKGMYSSDGLKSLTIKKAITVGNSNCLGLGPLEKEVQELYLKVTRYRLNAETLFMFTSDDHRLVLKKQ